AFYQYAGEEALAHLFRVTAGLDSMVMGEPEITGQVKAAWARSQAAGTAGRGLERAFQKALNVTKRVRTETAIGNAAVSVPYAAVELAKQIFGSLNGRNVMILGAGKMGELSARYLKASGASGIFVTNRTHENAVALAESLGGTAVPFEDRWTSLATADIVICSTGSTQPILEKHDAERIRQQRGGRPVFLIDIAVPRDVDPAVREVSGVFHYDIDDLQQVVNQNLEQRKVAAAEAEIILQREAHDFQQKLGAERVVPTLVALHDRLNEIRTQELRNFSAEHSNLPQAEMDEIEVLTERIIQRIGNQMARELKQIQHVPEQEQLTDALRRLFQLHRPAPISSVRG
ncbi:MAG: glutamyl-tRNA reductase, partial [Acidobacteria bacterium]|nr:glutamyl-tRNA reductase [Acidobacteriota bacterium]